MNKKKLFLTASVVILGVAGVFAGMRKFAPSTIYLKTAGGCKEITGNNSITNWSLTGTDQAVILTRAGVNSRSLWEDAACDVTPLHFTN